MCFICFIGVTNATTKTCSYIFDTTENNNYLEEYSLNFNLTFSDDGQGGLANFAMKINGKELVPYSANGEIYELENLPSTVFTNPKNSDKSTFYIFKSDNFYKEGLFEPDSSDNYYINLMNKHLHTNHHTIIIDTPELANSLKDAMIARDTPGMADIDSSLLLFCKNVKKEMTVSLTR